jgi:hypothetical protein
MKNLLNYIIFLKLQKGSMPFQTTGVNYIGLTENGNWYLKSYSNEGTQNVVFRQHIFKQHQTEILNRIMEVINNGGGTVIMGEPSKLITHD